MQRQQHYAYSIRCLYLFLVTYYFVVPDYRQLCQCKSNKQYYLYRYRNQYNYRLYEYGYCYGECKYYPGSHSTSQPDRL